MLYALSGLLSGLAGLLFAARINAGEPTAGLNYELTAITATIIGGTNLFGGRGSVVGTIDRRADHGRAAERPQPARRAIRSTSRSPSARCWCSRSGSTGINSAEGRRR